MANVSFCYTPLTFVETRWLRKIAAAVAAGEDVRPPPAKVRDDSLFDDMTQNPCNRKDARLEAVGGKIGGPSAKIGGRAVVPARPFISSDFFLENRGNNGLSKAGLAALAKLEKVIEAVPSAAALENERANVKEGKIHHISLGYTGDGQWGKTTAAKLRAQLVEDTSIKGVWQRQLFDAVVVLANAEKITDWTAAGVGVTGTVAPTVLLNARTGVHVDGKNWGWSTQVVGGTYARVAAEGENVGNGVPEARGGRLFVHDPAGKDYQEYERKDADLQLPSLQVGMWDKVAQRTGKTDAALPGQFFVCPIFDVVRTVTAVHTTSSCIPRHMISFGFRSIWNLLVLWRRLEWLCATQCLGHDNV